MGMHKAANVISTKNMTYNAVRRHLVAEASDVGFYSLALMYDDAADIGVYLKSHKTGNVKPFFFDGRISDGEDTLGWKFKNDKEQISLTIYND